MVSAEFVETGAARPPGTSGKCRILYVVGQLHTGGLERQLYYLLRSIDRQHYRPVVAVWNYGAVNVHAPPIRALGVPIYSISSSASKIAKLKAFRRLVRELDPEVVHSYSFHTNVAASWAVCGTRAIAIGSVRSDFNLAKRESGPLLGRLCGRWPGYQIFNSVSATMAPLHARSFFVPKHCDVVTNGIDLQRFRKVAAVPDGPARIVGIGYLLPIKRWERLLEAARALKEKKLAFRMSIVGGGPLRRDLEERAQALDVLDRVQFVNHTDDVPGLLAESSFMVLTSDSEGYPNAVMEAMACGRAVIATDVGDIPNLVDDGVTGFLVRPGDAATLAERIERLIGDRDLCGRMGDAARVKAERQFGFDRLGSETLAAYRNAGWVEART